MRGEIYNRDPFLSKVAQRLGRKNVVTNVQRPNWTYGPQHKVLQHASSDELLNVLIKQCENIHTAVKITSKAKLENTVQEVVAAYGGGPVVTWKDERFNEYGLTNLFLEKWPKENVPVHIWDYALEGANIEKVEKANVGITISDITLAESGTAVLFSHKNKGRTVSFLPLTSIIIIPKSSIVPRMTQAAQMIQEKVNSGEQIASAVNFITGPSNSADIELNLVVGVHGPVKATYIVVEDI